ncbi:MAG TPA: hypothetical protein VGC76_02975 [Pyrinomonadaceae bacterium]|jgi:hypothetical protein
MKILNKILPIIILCLAPIPAAAQADDLKIPAEIEPFIEKEMKAITLESADLDGDGKKDFILVLDKAKVNPDDEYTDESERPMLILTRGADGKLTVAARNTIVARCRNCGGAYGDPFDGVTARRSGFTIANTGGSSDRWLENFDFVYSRLDKTWQLVKVVQTDYNTFQPKRAKTKVYTPRNFGKINFTDFDPDNFTKKK